MAEKEREIRLKLKRMDIQQCIEYDSSSSDIHRMIIIIVMMKKVPL